MKNLYATMKLSHILIGFIIIFLLINLTYYNHVYKTFKKQISHEKTELINITINIRKLIHEFNNNVTLLDKIKVLENKVMENKYEIGYLKNKNKYRKDIVNILKDIVLKSNVKLVKIELLSEKSKKETGKILLRFCGDSTLENFIFLLDKIENKQEFLTVESYKLKNSTKGDKLYNVEMILKFVYIIS